MSTQEAAAAARWPSGVLVGAGSALLGLAPWLVSGAILPLQNLWSTDVPADDMPIALLPVNQYFLSTIVALPLFGAVVAGLLVRVRRAWLAPALIGLLVLYIVAAVQSLTVVGNGLADASADSRVDVYFTGMLLSVVCAHLFALAIFGLVTRRSLAAVAIGIGLSAVPVAGWFSEWARTFFGDGNIPIGILDAVYWLPAVLVGVALGLCGVKPVSRLAVWATDLLLLWVLPAVFSAVTATAGTRVLGGDLAAMLTYAGEAFRSAMTEPPWPLLLAVGLAVVITIARHINQVNDVPSQSDQSVAPAAPNVH